MKIVGATLGCHFHDAAAEAPKLGAYAIGCNTEFLDRVLRGYKSDKVTSQIIKRNAVDEHRALSSDAAANLVVTPPLIAGVAALVGAGGTLTAALRHDARYQADQV